MNSESPTPHESHDALPDDLRAIAGELDALATDERHIAPSALEDRLALRTTASLGAGRSPVLARIGFGARGRVAAAIAIVVTASLLVVAMTQRVGSVASDAEVLDAAAIEAEFEAWLVEPAFATDDGFAALQSELDAFDATLGGAALEESDPLFEVELESTS